MLVVGGGSAAERRVEALLEAGVDPTVISPHATRLLARHAAAGRIALKQRPYRAGDLHGFRLVCAATADERILRAVRIEARAEGSWLIDGSTDLSFLDARPPSRHPAAERGVASQLVFLDGRPDAVDWRRQARSPATLVIFAGLHDVPSVVRQLLDYGRDPQCSVAVVESGDAEGRRTVVAPLAKVSDLAVERGIQPPSLIVVGEAAVLRDRLG